MVNNGLMVKDEPQETKEGDEDGADDSTCLSDSKQARPTYHLAEGVPSSLSIHKSALESLVRWYCREAGGKLRIHYCIILSRKKTN